jgi:hypothetical protein
MQEFEEDDLFGMIISIFEGENISKRYGTAFIIKQTLTHYILLTAAHNLSSIDPDFPEKSNFAKKSVFRLQFNRMKEIKEFPVESYIIHPKYLESKGVEKDIALVFVENRRYHKF